MLPEALAQALFAVVYYAGLVVVMRLLGKRLAGQTTTFDLVVAIQIAVVLQSAVMKEGALNALVFVATVLAVHRLTALACARWDRLRHLLRGAPTALVRDGRILEDALLHERISHEELMAGLRKLGYESPAEVKLAVLEETGHISALSSDSAGR